MKFVFFLFLIACSTAPSVKNLTYKQTITHQECLKPLQNLEVSAPRKIQSALLQSTGTAGSYILTSAGVVTDTVVVSTGFIGTVYLCSQGGGSSGCGEVFGGYMGVMEHLDLLWTTKKAFNGTSTWRCPYVDHISKAMRKVSDCLYDNGEYVAAFEQLSIIESDPVMDDCLSSGEKKKNEMFKSELVTKKSGF